MEFRNSILKHELSLAVLDPDSDTAQVDMAAGMEELKRRLEILLGEAQASGGAVYTAGYRKGTVYEVGQRHYGMMRAFPEWFAWSPAAPAVRAAVTESR